MNKKFLSNKKHIFWDFDGVIKDSVEIKSNAYEELFLRWGKTVSLKVRHHHRLNGGMSRFDKIPLYLSWTNIVPNENTVTELCNDFSKLVKLKVINSPWVPGVIDVINYSSTQGIYSYIVTATPQEEIEEILDELQVIHYFKNIVGAPKKKVKAINEMIDFYGIALQDAIMIGDSKTDYEAAKENNIDFILRKTHENLELQSKIKCTMFDNFL